MSGMEIDQHICKEAQFVDENYVALVQRVTSVMALADDLKSKDMIHEEKYSEIKAARTNQGKMRKLYEALHSGGDKVKTAFYNALREHEPLLFNKLESLKRSPTEPKKKEMLLTPIPRLKISYLEASGLYLHPSSPDCQACVHIVDSDQWVKVEPSVCRDERESKFRISTPLGRYECIRTRLRWVCDCDVTLQYRAVDGCSLTAELERLQCERIGPVIDVTVISGKLKEAHLPHYACLAESDPSLKDAVKVLSQKDEGFELQSVELTRFHAKILQPSFSLTTLIINWLMKWEEHFNLLLYMRCNHPLILHVYFFPLNDTCLKEKVEQNEKSSIRIPHPRPNRPFRMKTPHLLEVPGASVHPKEGISFRRDTEPNFFKVKQDQDGDVQMTLIKEEDHSAVWEATVWENELEFSSRIRSESQGDCGIEIDNFVLNFWSALIQRVTNVKKIADKLLKQKVIEDEIYLEITQKLTTQDNMRKTCSIVNSGGLVLPKFISIL